MTLIDLPDVPLARLGKWDLSTGSTEFTPADFAAALEAATCPAMGRPIIKLGHVDPRYDGQPAVGFLDNLRVEGDALVGDYRGMPDWLAAQQDDGHSVLASGYPSRSIEGWRNKPCAAGHIHPFALSGVALLGVTPPGVTDLPDVASLYGIAAAGDPTGEPFSGVALHAPPPTVTGDDVARIAASQTTGNHAGEPSDKEGTGMSTPESIREQVGLPATATDDELNARLTELVDKATTPVVEPTAPVGIDELVAAAVDKALTPVLAALESTSGELATIKASKAADDKAQFFAAALADGKVTPAEVTATWDAAYDENPALVGRILAAKAPGSAMPIRAAGYQGTDESAADSLTEADEAFLKGL